MEKKTVFITGGNGNLGGAVAHSLINKGFQVKVLTRKPASPKIQALENRGAKIVVGDLNHKESFEDAFEKVDGVFCVLSYDHGIEKEIRQGFLLVELAKANSVNHFVYSSVIGADLRTGIPHWESKYKIENHIKASGLPFTIIRPCSLYENFLFPAIKNRVIKGTLSTPVKEDVVQQFIGSRDIGEIAASVFSIPDHYLGKTFTVAAEEMDMKKVASAFSEVLGIEIKYKKLPMLLTRLFMGKDNARMFKWVNEHNATFVKDLNAFKNEYPNLLGLREWIRLNF